MPPLANIARRKPNEILLALEAFVLLAIFRIALAFLPVRRILRAITHPAPAATTAAQTKPDSAAIDTALHIRWAVQAITRNAPAQFVCFPQSLAGYIMLRRRRIHPVIVYGVAHSPEGKLIAHTWLTLADRTVLGGEGAEAFTPIERWS